MMRPGLRLATSNVFGRRSRTILLIVVVALSAALIAAVTTAMTSIQGSLSKRLTMVVGTADARIHPLQAGKPFDASVVDLVRGWPEVDAALPRLDGNITLRAVRPKWAAEAPFSREVRAFSVNTMTISLGDPLDQKIRPVDLTSGRLPVRDGEVAISQVLLDRLCGREGIDGRRSSRMSQMTSQAANLLSPSEIPAGLDLGPAMAESADGAAALNAGHDARVGSKIQIARVFRSPMELTIVGVTKSELLGGRPQAWVTRETLEQAIGQRGKLTNIDIVFKPGVDPTAAVAARKEEFREKTAGQGLSFDTTEKVVSGFKKNLQNNDIPLLVASTLAFLSAAFIITTGMTVNIAERKRELAVLRCIGASRWQVGEAQLWTGLAIGVIGAAVGVPVGVGMAVSLLEYFKTDLKLELFLPTWRLAYAGVGSVVAAVGGAAWPAWQASRLSPLRAMASRAELPRRRGILVTLAIAAALIAAHPQALLYGLELDRAVPIYLFAGMPALVVGYFLLGVPLLAGVTRVVGVVVARVMRVEPLLLVRSLTATPYRWGLTAGAMMTGLALMVAMWTQGRAVAEDWLGRIQFPEVFVLGTDLKAEYQAKVRELPFVTDTVAVSLLTLETRTQNQTIIASDGVTFIAFEPRAFFSLAKLTWVQGDVDTAQRRMEAGGSVIVAREFYTANGKGLGDTIELGRDGVWAEFEIVGVVSSPGLDLVNQYFEIGNAFAQTATQAVFGTREDLRARVLGGAELTTQLFQVGLKPAGEAGGVSDAVAEAEIRRALSGTQVLDVGNGRKLKLDLSAMIQRSILVVSTIAVMSMLVACLGVANLIVAGIEGRQFEFGVLRAVGATRGMVLRLVLAEAVLVAVTAMILGSAMGIQAVWAGQKVDSALLGIELHTRPPVLAVLAGCGVVLVMTVGAAVPAVMALARRKPRELLAAVKG